MRRTAVLLILLAAALAAGVYANALHNPFVYDDRTEVVENQSIRAITNLPLIVRASLTRPLVNLSYAVDYAIWGLNPFGYHLTNLLLHIISVGVLPVLAVLTADLCKRAPVVTFGAIWFAVLLVSSASLVPLAAGGRRWRNIGSTCWD